MMAHGFLRNAQKKLAFTGEVREPEPAIWTQSDANASIITPCNLRAVWHFFCEDIARAGQGARGDKLILSHG